MKVYARPLGSEDGPALAAQAGEREAAVPPGVTTRPSDHAPIIL